MWRHLFIVVLLLVAQKTLEQREPEEEEHEGNFLVVGPRNMRPGLKYSVSALLLKDIRSNSLKLEVLDMNTNRSIIQQTARGLKTGEPRTVVLQGTSSLVPQTRYKLRVELSGTGSNGSRVRAEGESFINLVPKSHAIFIQTDKAKYKPGDTVKYRVVVVKPDLKPYKGKVEIKIKDGNQNLIVNHKDQSLGKGVFGSELQLSEQPPLGAWTIQVKTADGEQFTKPFTVEKYVLPKFQVKITPPAVMTVDQDLIVKISAKYTYGKGIDGKATVTAKDPWGGGFSRPVFQDGFRPGPRGSPAQKREIQRTVTLDDNGEATVTFRNDALKSKNLIKEWSGQIKVEATVTEELTGIEQSEEVIFPVHKDPVRLEVHAPQSFKPGMDFKYLLAVVTQDGKPIPASYSRRVKVEMRFAKECRRDFPPRVPSSISRVGGRQPRPQSNPCPKPIVQTEFVQLGSDGTKQVSLKFPKTSKDAPITSVNINAKYDPKGDDYEKSSIQGYRYLSASKSPSNNFLQLTPLNRKPVKIGSLVSFRFKCSDPSVQTVQYQVLSRGAVVLSETASVSEGQIRFQTTADMAPSSRIVVFAVRPANKEVLVDASRFQVEGLFSNEMSVSLSKTEAKPADEIEVSVSADPRSFVGLLAVDQSVQLLETGNDITTELVENEIASFDHGGRYWGGRGPMPFGRKKRSIVPWGFGGNDADSIFRNSGLLVITDAWVYSQWSNQRMTFGSRGAPAPMGPVPAAARGMGGARPQIDGAASNGFDGTGGGGGAPRVRSEFPETWIWADLETSSSGRVIHRATVPDTITSWVLSGFAVSDKSGLGVVPESKKLKVFREFFVSLNLPYSVKRGEKLALQVLVFNYMPRSQDVTVTLEHKTNSGFDFVEKNGALLKSKATGYNVRTVKVPGDGGAKAVFFPIVPNKIGRVMLKVTGRSGRASDAVERPLLVEPEGFRVEQNEPVMVDLSSAKRFQKTVRMEIPREAVEDSEGAEVAIVGDLMGSVLQNIESLVRMPYGCGEQNMINFVPNIVVMDYLTSTGRLTPEIQNKAKSFMEAGYQRELTYKRRDNSFSAFGDSDEAGSTWLTAFVAKSFKQAQEYITVDQKVMDDAVSFLESKQTRTGDFSEDHEVHHNELAGGGSSEGVPLTAYVLITMLKNNKRNNRALQYVEGKLSRLQSPYSVAIATYALHKANSRKKDEAFRKLDRMATVKGGLKYWEEEEKERDDDKPFYWHEPPPANVEMTAYALLTMMERGDVAGALPVVRWLTSQRNAYGGYSSTQDTVMALQALGEYAKKAYSPNFNVNIKASSGRQRQDFNVNRNNALLFQALELNSAKLPVKLSASGSGIIHAQVSWHYNLKPKPANAAFDCTPSVASDSKDAVELAVCCRYKKGTKSKMAVIGVDALSGHQIDEFALNEQTKQPGLQRVELTKGNTHADIYFESISNRRRACVNVSSQPVFKVSERKDAVIETYNFYKPSEREEISYGAREKKSFAASCPDCWPTGAVVASGGGGSGGVCRDRRSYASRCRGFCPRGRRDQEFMAWRNRRKAFLKKYCPKSCNFC